MAFLHSYKRLCLTLLTTLVVLALAATEATATTIGITSSDQLFNSTSIDWSAYGADFDLVANGTTKPVPGLPGNDVTIAEQTGFDFLRVTEGSSWAGNFADGDALLYTTGGGPMDFVFNSPIAGFGSQIQAGTFGDFTARIEAFDAFDTSLGFFTANGTSAVTSDGSALFLGLVSNALDISRIRLSLTSAQPDSSPFSLGDFAVNDPLVTTSPVPEPTSLILLGSGLVMAADRLRKRVVKRA